jgi:arthrofactin-type cyclic lipopeptide synthetase C
MYDTGDLARWFPDGRIAHLGRNDHQVKIRGHRVELGDVEARLSECAGVGDVAVTVHEGADGAAQLVAYYAGDDALSQALRFQARNSLPGYMLPSHFVALASLPRTPNGKLDRNALPAPGVELRGHRQSAPPIGTTEEVLAEIVGELLSVGQVGREDDFFALGGHSLLIMRLVALVHTRFGIQLDAARVYANPTVAAIAAAVQAATPVVRPAIDVQAGDGPLPLSLMQQRLWFLSLLEGASQAYHLRAALRLRGQLDRDALTRAMDTIVARHEILRTRFVVGESGPVQVRDRASLFELEQVDLSECADAATHLARLSGTEEGLDLAQAHGIRARQVRLSSGEHVLTVTLHHLVSDGWSLGVLFEELASLYAAYSSGHKNPLPALPIQYGDYAVWQRAQLADDVMQRQRAYWLERLSGAPALLELPTDRPRPAQQRYAGASVDFVFDSTITRGLRALAQQDGATLFMTVLSGWAVLLRRLSGQSDLVIGTAASGRSRSELHKLIGLFVNTLALRLRLGDEGTVSELLQQAKEVVVGAQQHQELPFEQVVEALNPARALSHSPVFQVLLAWNDAPMPQLSLPGLATTSEPVVMRYAQFDLTLSLQPVDDELRGTLNYATSLFDHSTAERHVNLLRRVLEEMVVDRYRCLSELSWLCETDVRQLAEWNSTDVQYAERELCVHEVFEAQVRRTPHGKAVVFEGECLSFVELNARANRLARHLRGHGVGPGARVAVCAERSVELVVALLSVLKAGGCYVPLDPRYPTERLSWMLDDCTPALVLTQGAGRGALESLASSLPALDLSSDNALWSAQEASDLPSSSSSDAPAYVIYTSGSTGAPKGAMNAHRGVVNRLVWMGRDYGLTENSVVLHKTPFTFDVSVWELFCPLAFGCCMVVARPDAHQDPAYLRELIDRHRVTWVHFVPSLLRVFLEHAAAAQCTSVERVFCSGEVLSAELAERAQQVLEGAVLTNLYGPTEAAVDVTAWQCKRGASTIPIGRPVANTRIYILDESKRPVPVGVPGELYIAGVQVGAGYLNRREENAACFLNDPFSQEASARMYRTGDWARWRSDGNLLYLGRNDHQVKVRGIRIELEEIEVTLARFTGVAEVAVRTYEFEPNDIRLVAYFRALPGALGNGADVEALRKWARALLPEHMVPNLFQQLGEFPLLPNGKLDRRALPRPKTSAPPEPGREPEGELEKLTAELWSELLGVAELRAESDFFALGGHSLLAARFIAAFQEQARRVVPLRLLFEAPTIEAFAAAAAACQHIEEAIRTPAEEAALRLKVLMEEGNR